MKHERDAYEGEWDFEGKCAPGSSQRHSDYQTFSLGCFQWVRRGKDGKGIGLKKGKVVYRVKGHSSNPEPAIEVARKYCADKNRRQALRPIEERSDERVQTAETLA